ncbi:F-box/kelch-repeat protein [Striga hermonthica]|uniref:F-box/kelch-repeat protein n=1 Tax=Striga hermonthica TaxID=68872 RepID=A0A9N7P3U7_STRHE|nr:F-box/kelch-repeat protein [Striga hermonthica]
MDEMAASRGSIMCVGECIGAAAAGGRRQTEVAPEVGYSGCENCECVLVSEKELIEGMVDEAKKCLLNNSRYVFRKFFSIESNPSIRNNFPKPQFSSPLDKTEEDQRRLPLVLRLRVHEGDAALWNPSTDEFKPLPPTSIRRHPDAEDFDFYCSGFGFDPFSQDFKVVRFVDNVFEKDRTCHAELYSLKSDSWEDITNPILHLLTPWHDPCAYVESSLPLDGESSKLHRRNPFL